MTSSARSRWAILLLIAGSVVACRKHASVDSAAFSMNIPAARGPKVALSPEDAALVYPDVDSVERDPFLYRSEERPDEAPVFERHTRRSGGGGHRNRSEEGPRPLVLRQLHDTVRGIIVGPRNTFFFQGKLYEEGDRLPDTDWVVASITPSGIDLRSRDGQTDRLAFVREADVGTFTFKRSR